MPIYLTCQEVCGQPKHCGNRNCSNHPEYVKPAPRGNGRRAKRFGKRSA